MSSSGLASTEGVSVMRNNCAIFTTPDRQEVRVVFDPDGVAFFCGTDLAIIAGYEAPKKAINGGNKGVNRIDTALRKVPWDNGMKRGCCERTCFTAENALKFLCRRPAPYAIIRWFEDEVIPKVQNMGEEVARGYVNWSVDAQKEQEPAAAPREFPETKVQTRTKSSALDRLDAIILECALLKRELLQTR